MTFLITAPGEVGHVLPGLAIAQSLATRGHRVLMHTSPGFEDKVRAAGAEYVPFVKYRDIFTRVRAREGVPPRWLPRRLHRFWRFRIAVLASASELAGELIPVLERERVTCVVGNFLSIGASYAADVVGCPYASVAPNPATCLDERGISWTPFPIPLPARLIHAIVDAFLPLARCRMALKLSPRDESIAEFIAAAISGQLHLVLAPETFAPKKRLRAGQLFVGPMSFDLPRQEGSPTALPDLKPGTVLVSTTTTDLDRGFLTGTLSALSPLGIPLLATGAGDLAHGLGEHVRIERFVPHEELFPRIAALVTHGGWGAVGRALRHGVPMLIVSVFGDQPMIGARAEELGLAYHLRARDATPERIRQALQRLLQDDALKRRVKNVADELRARDSRALTAAALERLSLASRPH